MRACGAFSRRNVKARSGEKSMPPMAGMIPLQILVSRVSTEVVQHEKRGPADDESLPESVEVRVTDLKQWLKYGNTLCSRKPRKQYPPDEQVVEDLAEVLQTPNHDVLS